MVNSAVAYFAPDSSRAGQVRELGEEVVIEVAFYTCIWKIFILNLS
jgi:hypothetical protein